MARSSLPSGRLRPRQVIATLRLRLLLGELVAEIRMGDDARPTQVVAASGHSIASLLVAHGGVGDQGEKETGRPNRPPASG
jgi:hypothetical protein